MAGSSRRRSRIVAFQALFEADSRGSDLEGMLERHLDESRLSPAGREFARHLVTGVAKHREQIDEIIEELAPAFPLAEMAPVDRNVLCLAIFEVLFDNSGAPLRVAINEAVEIAKGYGSEASGRFVNGVLGAVALTASGGGSQ